MLSLNDIWKDGKCMIQVTESSLASLARQITKSYLLLLVLSTYLENVLLGEREWEECLRHE